MIKTFNILLSQGLATYGLGTAASPDVRRRPGRYSQSQGRKLIWELQLVPMHAGNLGTTDSPGASELIWELQHGSGHAGELGATASPGVGELTWELQPVPGHARDLGTAEN